MQAGRNTQVERAQRTELARLIERNASQSPARAAGAAPRRVSEEQHRIELAEAILQSARQKIDKLGFKIICGPDLEGIFFRKKEHP